MKFKDAAMLAGILAAGNQMFGVDCGGYKFNTSKPKMIHPFTDEEIETMKSMSIKEKKKYLKVLHEKYAGQLVEAES